MIPNKNSFRPGSKPDWRKRLASVTRYIDDLESCLAQANAVIITQQRAIHDLRQHVQYQNSILGTGTGGHNEHCAL